MADKRISDLTAVTSLAAADLLPVVQSGTTKKATVQDVWDDISVSTGNTIKFNNSSYTASLTEPTLTGNIVLTFPASTGTFGLKGDQLKYENITLDDASRTITLNGATSSDLLNIGNGTNNCLVIKGNGQAYSSGPGFVDTNTAFGNGVFANTTPTGTNNTAIGRSAMINLTSGGLNTAIGGSSLGSVTTGFSNMAIGYQTLQYITTTSSNVGIGTQAGRLVAAGTNNTGASNSVYIGFDARPSAASQTNQIVIGDSAIGNGSNTATIGNSSIVGLYIGTTLNLYQETTGVTAATFTANTSGIANDTATFDGYTIGQVVAALRLHGLLA